MKLTCAGCEKENICPNYGGEPCERWRMRKTETLGERMKLWRMRFGVTMTDWERMMYVNRTTAYNYERGESEPRASDIMRFCKAVGITADEYLGMEG